MPPQTEITINLDGLNGTRQNEQQSAVQSTQQESNARKKVLTGFQLGRQRLGSGYGDGAHRSNSWRDWQWRAVGEEWCTLL
jgi:hypothetical protein